MKLSDYLYKNVQITTDKEATLTGYVANYFRGADNDDGLDSIGLLKKHHCPRWARPLPMLGTIPDFFPYHTVPIY